MKAVCAMHNLSFSYGSRRVLENISLTITPGTMVALVGPNGSGKTSLLRILAGLEKPEQGTVHFFGRDAQDFSPKERARRIAYMPQLIQDDLPLTARQFVRLGRAPWQNSLGMETPRDIALVSDAMRYVNMEALADRPVFRLSGGERQRAALALVLCQQPELFLLDEPTAALDYGHQIQIMDMLDALRQERKISIILVSHDVNLAAMYANQIILVREGRIAAHGSPLAVLTQENVSSLYGCSMLVDINPWTNSPRVSPLPMAIQS